MRGDLSEPSGVQPYRGEVREGECEGIITVCCVHAWTSTELSRVPRQLSLSPIRAPASPPRQARLATLTSPESPRFNYHQNKILRKSKHRGPRVIQKSVKKVRAELDNFVGVGGGGEEEWRGCGVSRQVAESRILGGADAGYGQFPWTALIQIYSRRHGLDKMCAGSLVQDR